MDEDKAERIRASRGNYEAEVTFTGELGLNESFIICDKNPRHLNFIRVKDFNINHLTSRYRDDLLVDLVRAQSDLTCRLSVSRISKDRPKTWPDSDKPFPFSSYKGHNSTMTGTGWVSRVYKYTKEMNKNCPCDECLRPGTHTRKKTWGEVEITTASHVDYNSEEARHTKCQFFYDSHETDINKVPTLTGDKVDYSDVTEDSCEMEYVTHDVELVDRLDKMWRRWKDLRDKVFKKYVSNKYPGLCVPAVGCDTNVVHDLCIIVSHPHGCSKVVTVGAWTHRQVVDKNSIDNREDITYSCNTRTCPGSSGTAVITLYNDNRRPGLNFNHPAHSQGRPAKPLFTPNTGRQCKGNTCVGLVKVLLWSLFLLHCPTFLVASQRECPEGSYMSPSSTGGQYECLPCPDGTFMPVSHSKHRQCYECTHIEDTTLEVLIRPCEKTRDADIQCVQGFYRVLPRNPRQKALCKECTPCHELFHEIRACQNYSNTYCCADVNYDFILDKSGTAWCRERNWMCRRGQYLDTSLNKCNPCPDNTFMAQDYHSYTSCWPCHSTLDAGVPLHTEIIQQCNSTHPALYRCKEGYYVNHTLSYRGTDIGCSPCRTCQQGTFVGRPCNTFQNTVCCPQENMTVIDGTEGVKCQDMPEVEEFLKFTTPSLGVLQNMTSQSQVTDSSYLQTKRETSIWLYVFTFIGFSATVGLLGLCLILFWRRCLVLFLIKGYWFRRKDDNVPDGFDLKNTKNRRGSLTAEHILLDKINDSSIFKSSGYGRNELMDEAVSIT